MHVFLFSQHFFPSQYSYPPFSQRKSKNPSLLLPIVKTIVPPSIPLSFSNSDLNSSNFDSPSVEDSDSDESEPSVSFSDQELMTVSGDGVDIEIEKIGNNSRRICSRIGIDASLETVWNLLTDYERLADFIPGLAVSQLLEKKENFAKIFQIGQQNLAFGLKFNAKGIVDCYEKDLQRLSFGQRRDIEFKMVEGDFQTFEGKWSIIQLMPWWRSSFWINSLLAADPRNSDSAPSCFRPAPSDSALFLKARVSTYLWKGMSFVQCRYCDQWGYMKFNALACVYFLMSYASIDAVNPVAFEKLAIEKITKDPMKVNGKGD